MEDIYNSLQSDVTQKSYVLKMTDAKVYLMLPHRQKYN